MATNRDFSDLLSAFCAAEVRPASWIIAPAVGLDDWYDPGDMRDRLESSVPSGRGSWSVRRFRLGEEPGDDLSTSTTAAERLAMMWPLALDAWAASGRAIPDFRRDETPVLRLAPATPDER